MSLLYPRTRKVDPRWDPIAPQGIYAKRLRPVTCIVAAAGLLPFALVPGLVVAVVNTLQFRSVRRIFYVQERIGYRGRKFRIYKFRTMSEANTSAHASWAEGQDQARVTRFGRFLRSTHLDELPQLFNILKGDMALIGPRPEMIEIEEWARDHVPGFEERLAIPPGITGYAQIVQGYTRRDVEAYGRKLELNRQYMRDLSFSTDVKILFRTIIWMLRGQGWLRGDPAQTDLVDASASPVSTRSAA